MRNGHRTETHRIACTFAGQHGCCYDFLNENEFRSAIVRERKRTERSHRSLLLLLIDTTSSSLCGTKRLHNLLSHLMRITRSTDCRGWYHSSSVLGIVFTDIVSSDKRAATNVIADRVRRELSKALTPGDYDGIIFSCHLFPGDKAHVQPALPFYSDVHKKESGRRAYSWIKRRMDIVVSALLLTALAPLFAVVAILIKLTSRGPVFYRQTRVGRFGKPFVFLKFRSMYVNSDTRVHKDYAQKIIAGRAGAIERENGESPVYKLVNDPRHTPIAGFLRRTSIDELPQLINVLRGEMSLVGPRPAIPYEVEVYDLWHRRRLVEVRPGITGLWQVEGRGRVTFDEMVRLDLRYASQWSPWLDAQLLLRTPAAVITGKGAY